MATDAVMVDPAALDRKELENELATLAAHIYAGTCRWLELVAELDRRGQFGEEGRESCAEWIAWRCGLAPRAAREHVRVARTLAQLPETRAAFARGELSYAKVRAISRVATEDNEGELLRFARIYTAAQLERTVRCYRQVSTEEAKEQFADAYLSLDWKDNGMLELHGRLAPEDGAVLLRALEARRDSRWQDGCGSAEPHPRIQVTYREALLAVADASLAYQGDARSGGERYQVVVYADEAVLEHDGEGGCELEDGSALSAETARRLACDASLVRDGRKSRTIPTALRRALRKRDRGCRFPGCEHHRFVDAHHVKHWAKGGETTLENLILLCRRHHRAVHEGGLSVDTQGHFYYPWGQRIDQVPPLPGGDPVELVARRAPPLPEDRNGPERLSRYSLRPISRAVRPA